MYKIHGTLVSGKRPASSTIWHCQHEQRRNQIFFNPTICLKKKKNEAKIPMMIMHLKALFL